jgi:hypothetical protein
MRVQFHISRALRAMHMRGLLMRARMQTENVARIELNAWREHKRIHVATRARVKPGAVTESSMNRKRIKIQRLIVLLEG